VRRLLAALAGVTVLLAVGVPARGDAYPPPISGARASAPLVLTGLQVPTWSRLPAVGVGAPYPSGATDGVRSAHNGTITVPPDARAGVPVDQIAAYRWSGTTWAEVPVQVDQRFPHFLANANSDFGIYSGTDLEVTYAWAPDAHSTGEEAWKKIFGQCSARYATSTAEVDAAVAAGTLVLGPDEAAAYLGAMSDPVPTLDDDDEIALNASDAGVPAPQGTPAPAGTTPGSGQTIQVINPDAPASAAAIYLFLRPGGSSFGWADGAVQMARAGDADEWIDRDSFAEGDPQQLGSSNTGYGPNLTGTVCDGGAPRPSKDRFPRDATTVSTPTYRLTATGRWMIRGSQITKPGQAAAYGPDLIDRWKGRAFQQSPDSSVSLVGFEDEQVNWEANSALLGWRAGPVRAIREIWGADSGTNVTKTETYYRDADVYRYHVRVHPIPSDGLYTSWDYNLGVASRYYNLLHPEGVAIDGIDDDTGNVDQIPVPGSPAPFYIDAPDPTHDVPSALLRPEQVAGIGNTGSAVYIFEQVGATSLLNPTAVPYYRDDACLDDGTGDNPVQRPWPGEASTDTRVRDGYAAANGASSYAELTCDPGAGKTPFQGAIASHGIHFFLTGDTDNATLPLPITEIEGQQWRFAVPMDAPTNVVLPYGTNVIAPLRALAVPFQGDPEAGAAAGNGDQSGGGNDATRGAAGGTTTGDATLPRTGATTMLWPALAAAALALALRRASRA
jgi:hypothetical protein